MSHYLPDQQEIEYLHTALLEARKEEADLRAQLAAAQAELADRRDSDQRVLSEQCPSDERHCGCVPVLRARLKSSERARQSLSDACDSLQRELREIKTELDRRCDKAEQELERERCRLAACGVVALADTPESANEARKMHPDYESASCSDVARRVDECIDLRAQLAAAQQEAAAMRTACQNAEAREQGLREALKKIGALGGMTLIGPGPQDGEVEDEEHAHSIGASKAFNQAAKIASAALVKKEVES